MRATDDTRRVVAEQAGREVFGKLTGYLAGRFGTHAEVEDALSTALVTALEEWPETGVPNNPAAWLITVARRRLADRARAGARATQGQAHLKMIHEELEALAMKEAELPDRRLELMVTCAHPSIDRAVQAPLMLQSVLGFDAAAIGTAFMVPGNTMGQRLARAKNKIRQAGIPFAVPDGAARGVRLDAVLALYTVLVRLAPSTGAAIGQAAALCMAGRPGAAMAVLDALDHGRIRDHQPYWAVRARALADHGHGREALDAYALASGLSTDPAEKAFLLENMMRLKKNSREL